MAANPLPKVSKVQDLKISTGNVVNPPVTGDNGNGKQVCPCGDYVQSVQGDPDFNCPHILEVLNTGGNSSKKAVNGNNHKLDARFIKVIEGKDFVLYSGLLDLAHQRGLLKLTVDILQFPTADNGNMAITRAVAESKLGEVFSDIGDASPSNCNAKVAKHLLRIASTRAKARVLRDLTNIGITCLEELDLHEVNADVAQKNKNAEIPNNSLNPKKPSSDLLVSVSPTSLNQETSSSKNLEKEFSQKSLISSAQKKAILNLSQRRGFSLENLAESIQLEFGSSLDTLSTTEASNLIRRLQNQ